MFLQNYLVINLEILLAAGAVGDKTVGHYSECFGHHTLKLTVGNVTVDSVIS